MNTFTTNLKLLLKLLSFFLNVSLVLEKIYLMPRLSLIHPIQSKLLL